MARPMEELVSQWENESYDMTDEQVMEWCEAAVTAMTAAISESNIALDPKPWLWGSMRNAIKTPGLDWEWYPRPEYEAAMSLYPKEQRG